MFGKSGKLKKLAKQMQQAENYREWKAAAINHDEASGMTRWKQMDQSRMYDFVAVRTRLDRLRGLRARQDHQGLLFALNEGIHGNIGGMGKAEVHLRAQFGTKKVIEDYIQEICDALILIAEIDESLISFEEKLDFFRRASHCYGRTGLMLSGAGALAHFHTGVVKTLIEEDILPQVISGSSGGALVAAVVGCNTHDQLAALFEPDNLAMEASQEASLIDHVIGPGRPQIDVHEVELMVNRLIPDLTFAEARELTGIDINISIAPAELHQTSRLLNATTSPNVYVRKGVMASCAVPGVFPPVMLSAKNVRGESQPYLPNRRWIDGSVTDDLPAKRLGRLYGVNHYIASQTNPLVLPFVNDSHTVQGMTGVIKDFGRSIFREGIRGSQQLAKRYISQYPRLSLSLNMASSLALQTYTADINLFPSFRYFDPRRILSHMSQEQVLQMIGEGERSTWPKIEMIRTCTQISRTLEGILTGLDAEQLHRAAKKPAKKSGKKGAGAKATAGKARKVSKRSTSGKKAA